MISKEILKASPRTLLIFYFILAYSGSWIIWGSFILSRDGTGLLPFNSLLPFFPTFVLGVFMGPAFAAFLLTGLTEGGPGISRLLQKIFLWRVEFYWYLVTLIGIPIVITVGSMILPGVRASLMPMEPWTALLSYLPFFFYPVLSIGGPLGEEPGWRGFALPRLQKLYGPLAGSLILGVLWAIWHLPIWLSGEWTQPNTYNIALFVTWITSVTIIMTWIYNHTKESVLIAILTHASFDAFPNAILWPLFPALRYFVGSEVLYGYVGLTVGFGATALVLILGTRGRLGYQTLAE